MIRRLLITVGLVLTLVLLNVGAAGARDSRRPPPRPTTGAILTASTTASSTHLLPGEQTWNNGASSYDFGTNDTVDYGSPNFDTLTGAGSPQASVKAAGLQMVRIWSYGGDTKAYVTSKVEATIKSGTTCMFMLGQVNSLTWLKKTVGWVKNTCHIFEFGNEEDNGGSIDNANMGTYTNQWIKDIPVLRALDPGAVFGGPVITWSSSCCQFTGNYPSDMAYFLAKTAAAGVRANFIDYHNYSCTGGGANGASMAACLANTPGDVLWNWNQVIGWENQYYGGVIPTGISEYNFDPGTNNLYAWAGDGTFVAQYTTEVINEAVSLGMAFALQFTSLNYAAYGDLDMFSDAAPYGPKPQFTAIASEVKKYKPVATLYGPIS